MIIFLKKNYTIILSFVLLCFLGLYCLNTVYKEKKQSEQFLNEAVYQCDYGDYKDALEYKDLCQEWHEMKEQNIFPDAIWFYFYTVYLEDISRILLVAPLFVIIPALYWFFREYRSGYFKNIITRKIYHKYMIRSYLSSLKCSLLIPIFLAFMLLASFVVSGFNFDSNYVGSMPLIWEYFKQDPFFIFTYVVTLILHSIFWINIAYLVAKRSQNFILLVIKTYVIYLGLWVLSDIALGMFVFGKLLGIQNGANYTNIINIWGFEYIDGNTWFMPCYALVLVLITLFMVYESYKNTEDVIICAEK